MQDYYSHIYEGEEVEGGGFVRLPNVMAIYPITCHADKNDREDWMEEEETYEDYRIEPTTMDIYRAIFQHRNTKEDHKHFGKAWPSQKRLAIELAINEKTLRTHIKRLERIGLLEIQRKYRNNRPFHVYSFPEPLSIKEFREIFPKACAVYEEKMRKLKEVEPDIDDL